MLLAIFGILAMVFTAGVIGFQNRMGVYCLVCVSGCMSLMFPTIYGIALDGLGDDAKFGAAGLIMAILGGSFFPPIQAIIIDSGITICGLPSTNISFIVPLACMSLVVLYGHTSYVRNHIRPDDVDDMLSTRAIE
jgi:FHS family L-fucose permease-like MFS transporter